MAGFINGFSKLTREEKISALANQLQLSENSLDILSQLRLSDNESQKILDELSENTLSNYSLPYSIAPNFLINGKVYHIPMVTEESSVVAAASKAAKFWAERGGFYTIVHSLNKIGQVHFLYKGNVGLLEESMFEFKEMALKRTSHITQSMEKRGGGIRNIELVNKTADLPNYFQLLVTFNTADAMGANFINTCLEEIASTLKEYVETSPKFSENNRKIEMIMSILSNYNPECLVESYLECKVDDLNTIFQNWTGKQYTEKFEMAVNIANIDIYRATTHNKGIFNGIDAVLIATGNDYRAIEAGAHTYASKSGQYRSLSNVTIENNVFRFSLKLPLTVGTVGGITAVHPLAKLSMQILQKPSAPQLMGIIASVGLASNFAAVNALITSGIQKGHMKMHLNNILNQLNATETQKIKAINYFQNKTISFSEVENFIKG